MKIITGRGNSRKVYDLPCADIIKRLPEEQVKASIAVICDILNIKEAVHG